MESTSTRINEDMFRMKCTIEVQKAMLDRLSTEMNEMKINFETEKKVTARKMAVLSHQNQVIKGKLKALEADSSSYKIQVLQCKGLQNEVEKLLAEKDSFDRLKKEMTDLVNGLKADEQHNDRPITSAALDSADCQIGADDHQQNEEFTAVSCVPVALPVKVNVTSPAITPVQVLPSTSEMMAKVTEESLEENHRGEGAKAAVDTICVSAESIDVHPMPLRELEAGKPRNQSTIDIEDNVEQISAAIESISNVVDSDCEQTDGKQVTAEPLIEIPVKSEQEARNRPGDAPQAVQLLSANGPMMTEDAISSADAFTRLLSSTKPCIQKLKELDMDALKGPEIDSCIDFLDQIAIEEGLQLSYNIYVAKSGQGILAGDRSYVRLSISPIGTATIGFGETVVEAQVETAYNCLLFFKHNMM